MTQEQGPLEGYDGLTEAQRYLDADKRLFPTLGRRLQGYDFQGRKPSQFESPAQVLGQASRKMVGLMLWDKLLEVAVTNIDTIAFSLDFGYGISRAYGKKGRFLTFSLGVALGAWVYKKGHDLPRS